MRVVSGTYRSRKINAVEGMETRPTADKIKEAVFSRIGPYFSGGIMLDCYSGSGNIAIEAISRGMSKAFACDISRKAIDTIQRNVSELKIKDQVEIIHGEIEEFLQKAIHQHLQFELIYLDPPYQLQKNEVLMNIISENQLLSETGDLIVESRKEDQFAERINDLIRIKEVIYGTIKITYYQKEVV